ncbi:arylamine N-acetyltransferase family protein [Streptomyces genisteinicus]|uniref:Arylamine N-acetyltransferase n=1 Tax=Streptomyces genisteinicus TaxID=2768068 RepID=A0A7H0I3G5_9ACTN|nr:arylamine N-acetyltransferase [Streptomyces genisteinicus]QNP67331.1 arylamine N-acetyltransferase [Streptomyces genisteinicus]
MAPAHELSSRETDAYLDRIGAARPRRADADALRELQQRHLLTVPFENLSVHLGEEVVLTEDRLVAKIVDARRGGFCYELNGAFAALLRSLGFRVTLHQARVFGRDGRLGIPFDHLTLRVETADGGGPWLADVGFGDHARYPLLLEGRADQTDPSGAFRVVEAPDHGDVDVLRDGRPELRVDLRPRELAEFGAACWYHRTSPSSHFTASLVCSRFTEDGRVTLSGRKLVRTVHGRRDERMLDGDQEVLDAYREHFGLDFGEVPRAAVFPGVRAGAAGV